MHPVQFEFAFEFTFQGRRYRSNPTTTTAHPIDDESPVGPLSPSLDPVRTLSSASPSLDDAGPSLPVRTLSPASPSLDDEGSSPPVRTLSSASPSHPPALRSAFDEGGPAPPSTINSLRKGLAFWELTLHGHRADLKHERGILYVAWLLINRPPHPIHALDLIARIPDIYRRQLGITEIADPDTGRVIALDTSARLQEQNLSAMEDAQMLRVILQKQKELEAILDDPSESEPVKHEALRELEALLKFQTGHSQRTYTNAQRAADSVRKAITRFHSHLADAKDIHGQPHPVLVPFANHIEKHIIIPSRRYAAHGNRFARSGLAGCFTYEPPPGVIWSS